MRFGKKSILILVALTLVGALTATGYLAYRYETSSRSADFSEEQRVEANHAMGTAVLENTTQWEEETVICIVDSAYRGLFQQETQYQVSIYILDKEAFEKGQAEDSAYDLDTLWAYSKSGPKKDPYQSLIKVGEATVVRNEKTAEILSFQLKDA